MSQEAPPSSLHRLALQLTVWLGIAMCLFDLVVEEATIWAGGAGIESPAPMAALVKSVAHAIAGNGWMQIAMPTYAVMWLSHYLVFIAAFWVCSRDTAARPGKTAWLLVLQALAGLAGDGQLTLGVAAQIAFYYRLPTALPALAVLTAARVVSDLPFILGMTGMPALDALYTGNFLCYQVRDLCIVFAMGYIARLAWHSSMRLVETNAALRAAQRQLAEVERDAERMRIARDLHDKIGHQLTAINLHLELGMRRAGDGIPVAVRSARELAGAVLAKLRVAVGRTTGTLDDAPSLQSVVMPDSMPRHAELFAWFGVAVCFYGLVCDQVALWVGQRQVLTFDVIYPLCRWLVSALLPAGAAIELALHQVYSWSWVLFYLAFGASFWFAARAPQGARRLSWLWRVQIVLAIVWHGQYLYAVLPQVSYRLPLRRALIWLGIIAIATALVIGPYEAGWMGFPPIGAVALWYFPIKIARDELAFFVVGLLARAAMQQRARLAATHAELHEAQLRLGEAARVAERLRIAGELHDVLGHDLAALNLQLDLGLRQSDEQLAEPVGVAHRAGRQLFDNIRVAIEQEKGGPGSQQADLVTALQSLCAGVPQPRIALRIGPLPAIGAALAHTLYSCVQEGITNAVRHAQADNLAVELSQDGNALHLNLADDGRGMQAGEANGLRGMRARVEQHGGRMHILPGLGCRIEIRIPVPAEQNNMEARGKA